MANFQKLQQVFADVLDIPPEQVVDSLAYNSIETWDSTAHMLLVAELEDSFDLMLDTDDIIDMNSFAKAKLILAKYEIVFD